MSRLISAVGELVAQRAPSLYGPLRESYHYLRFWAGQPHEADFRFFRRIGRGPGLFLDAGANSGISALSFACMNHGFQIHSFEPNRLLERRLARVQRLLGKRFTFTMCALGEENREATLFIPVCQGIDLSAQATLSRAILEESATREQIGRPFEIISQPVSLVRLDDFELPPDIIKLDVEGWELAILRGAMKTLARHHPALLIETNDATADVMACLSPLGYQFYGYDSGQNRLVPWTIDWPSPNYFALIAERHAAWLDK